MKPNKGKFYKTECGLKVGPMEFLGARFLYPWRAGSDIWTQNGKYSATQGPSPMDLVAEWSDPAPSPDHVAIVREMREALEPFSQGWQAALDAFGDRSTTLANFGAVAADHVGAVDFRRAHAALAKADAYLREAKPCA